MIGHHAGLTEAEMRVPLIWREVKGMLDSIR
jgi:hypothetical protein